MNTCATRSLAILALCSSLSSAADLPKPPSGENEAPWLTSLSLGNGGYWRQRIRVAVGNNADQPARGQTLELKIGKDDDRPDLEGVGADSLRLVDGKAVELLWTLTGPDGRDIQAGPIPHGSTLSIPAVCPAQGHAEYYLYFDNPAAWSVPDFLPRSRGLEKGRSGPETKLTVRTMPAVRLSLTETGTTAAWPERADGTDWAYRYPVRVLNTSAAEGSSGLAIVDLAAPMARLNRRADMSVVRVMDGEKPVESFRVGNLLLFESRAKPRTQHTYYVYFRQGSGTGKFAGPVVRDYAANTALPGGQSKHSTQATAPAEYRRLLQSPRNLIKNPSFELGDSLPIDWPGGAKDQRPTGSEMGLVEPGLFGKRCARIMFPAGGQPQWFGWRQEVKVKPGKSYLLSAWLKCRNLDGGLQLYVHFHNARGEFCREPQTAGAGPAIDGTADWTLLQGVFPMPDDIATLQVHLTMLAHGTAWHDGVVLTEVTPACLGTMESRAAVNLSGVTVWPVNAVEKVFQDDAPEKPHPARITAARNEKEPLQLAVRSPRAVPHVQVVVEPPTHASGKRLTDVSVGVVGYVPVDHPTNYYSSKSPAWQRKVPTDPGRSDGWAGWWPDPILPRDTFGLAAQVTQPVWITINVPKNATAGDYRGKVRFMSAGTALAEMPFTVRVWGFAIPDEVHIKAIFDCRQGDPMWAVPGKTPEQTRRAFWQFMAQRRVCPDRITPEPKLRYENGHVVADFTAFDEAADFYFNTLKLPHSYTPELFYCFGWGHPPAARFGEEPYEGGYPFTAADRGKLRPQFKKAYQARLKAFWDHIRAKGWERKFVLYISDEPFDSQEPIRRQMKALCEMIHEVDRAIPIYSSTWHHQPDWDGSVTVWGFGHYGVVPVEKLEQIRRDGATLWWTTDGHMCIDTPYCAVERLLPHYCFKFGAEAYEFWGVDWLTYNPYARGWHSYIEQSEQPGNSYYVRYPNGDGYLVYPGAPVGHAGPVTSIRLEQAREGCEDYECLYLLRSAIARAKQAGRDTARAEQVLAEAQELVTIPNAGGLQSTRTLPNPDAVFAVKESVARAIEELK
jgi:hypothetical protein